MDGQTQDLVGEELAVRALIEKETAAFRAKDFDRWATCWVQDDRTQDVSSSIDRGVIVQSGWEAVAGAMRQLMADNPEPIVDYVPSRDFQITVRGQFAWATYRSWCHVASQVSYVHPEIYETRVLEKGPGGWRIAYASVLWVRDPDDVLSVKVDAKGRVLWASAETLEALKDHDALTISAGVLRARRPAWDKVLRQRIAQVSRKVHIFGSGFKGPDESDRIRYPTVLGEADDGAVMICTVQVRNGAVAVSFDTGTRMAERVAGAAEIYNLSPAQRKLAERLVAGDSLVDAAQGLGITINTARTHLSRIYDKTGVNAHAPLVRVLLSVAAA